MQPIPYLFFTNTAREAFETYGRIFGAKPEIMAFSDMPGDEAEAMPGVPPDAVMHAALKVGAGWVYGSDDPSGQSPAMAGCNLHVEFDTEEETRRVWDRLSEGGEVRMPLEPSFWAPLFGALTDRFGPRWMIAQAPSGG
jgi:PhnB protein